MNTLEIPILVTEPPARSARERWAPRDRPPLVGRIFVGLLGVATMLTTAALLLSDRAPGFLRSTFGDRVRRLWERIDTGDRVELAAGPDVTQPDFMVHVALWAVVTVLVGLTIWTWRGLVFAAAALVLGSLGLELAQGRYAPTRNVEASDALGNILGIALGAAGAALCYLAWSGGAAVVRRLRPGRA